MTADTGRSITALRVDGGAAANDLLMQMQADLLGTKVIRGQSLEMTGLGAAFLAGLGSGTWSTLAELRSTLHASGTFAPQSEGADFHTWKRAVERSRSWVE